MALHCTVCRPRMPAEEDSECAEYFGQFLLFWGRRRQSRLWNYTQLIFWRRGFYLPPHTHLLRCMRNIVYEGCTALLEAVVSVSKLARTPFPT